MSERDRSIDETMAALVKGMSKRGDIDSDIAAFFLVNHGRVNEIKNGTASTGEKFRHVKAANEDALPPPWDVSAYELWLKGKWP
jgi:hypothetical protein